MTSVQSRRGQVARTSQARWPSRDELPSHFRARSRERTVMDPPYGDAEKVT